MTDVSERTAGDTKLANTRTVDALQRVYAMVIALALTTAVKLLIEAFGVVHSPVATRSDPLAATMMFIAFLSTLVVFYHGMNRHLDDTFVIGVEPTQRRLPLLIDIFVFLLEGGLLVVMASTIDKPSSFLLAWSALLAIDIVWGLYVYLIVKRLAPAKWIANNASFMAGAWILWLYVFPQNVVLIAVVESLRSVVDYWLNWDFYFPRQGLARQFQS